MNAALAAGVGLPIGAAIAETVKYFVGDHVRLICQTCGTETTMKERVCPSCDSPLPGTGEFWIGVGLAGTGVAVLVLILLTLSLNLPLVLIAGALLGAGIDLILDSLWAYMGRPAPTTGASA